MVLPNYMVIRVHKNGRHAHRHAGPTADCAKVCMFPVMHWIAVCVMN